MVKVLVVGQTPPPYGGQAMMIQRLVNAKFKHVEIKHVRLAFSDGMKQVGRVSFHKITHLFSIIWQVYKVRFSEKKLVLYYPPAGPDTAPIIRDLILLFFIKPLFYKTIYHFRAAGISEYLQRKPKWFQWMCKTIYGKPDIGIQLSLRNPADAAYFGAKKIVCIPNGLEDDALSYLPLERKNTGKVNILFVGVLREDKGLNCLVDALDVLQKKGMQNFSLTVMGDFTSKEYEAEIKKKIAAYKLESFIEFVGVKIKVEKWKCFLNADMLCFPSYFNSESFGNVVVEAMMFQLPVIATEWRGIPDIVTEQTGFLVPIKNAEALAEKIEILIGNSALRLQMGKKARQRFVSEYSLDGHLSKMETVLLS
jgi:glycosyltransferase involved in cell wall biosynthesis